MGFAASPETDCEDIAGIPGDDAFPATFDCASGGGKLMAVGGSTATQYAKVFKIGACTKVSPDANPDVTLSRVAYLSGTWAACGRDGGIASTDDGVTWAPATGFPGARWLTAGDSKFYAGETTLWSSSDGKAWTDSGASLGPGRPLAMVPFGSTWVGIESIPAGSGAKVFTSPDATTWTDVSPVGVGPLVAVSHNSTTGSFLIGGASSKLWLSTDAGLNGSAIAHPMAADYLTIQGSGSTP